MSFRHLDNIDEKIIDATIQIGSSNGANRLSTKEIAKLCGISEFVIYDHFRSKDNLISIANHRIFDEVAVVISQLLGKENVGFETFWNRMVDWYISHPNYTTWSIHYGHVFPRAEKPFDEDDFLVDSTREARLVLKNSENQEDWKVCYLSLWILRNIIYFAQLVLSKQLDNTPEIRGFSCATSYGGVKQFWDK
jgi:Transcriptional regulator